MDAAFLITSLIVVVTPGTGVIYTLSAGLTQGRRAGVVAATGCTLGIVPHMAATISGVAALMHASATAFQVLKYLGVAYLLYMAWATLKDKDPIVVEGEAAPRTAATRMVVRGILINILNPKLTMFFFAFLPQFVDPGEEGSLLRMLELSAVFMLLTIVVFAAYGAVAAALRTHVISRPRVLTWMRRFFAGSFVALGAKLASATR